MKFSNIMMAVLMVVAISSIASATLDAKVYTLCEGNISINLTPNFRLISDQSTSSPSGMFIQSFRITGTGYKGIAELATMDIYDENVNALGSEAVSQMFSSGLVSVFSYLSDSETDNAIGNWSAVDKNGRNVTVDTLDTKRTPLSIYGKSVDLASWNIEDNRYAFLLSSFDKDVTRQIINTLEIN